MRTKGWREEDVNFFTHENGSSPVDQCVCFGQNFIKFLPIQRIFHGKHGPHSPDFEKKKKVFKSPDFCDKF